MNSKDQTCRVIQGKLWNPAMDQVPNTIAHKEETCGVQVSSDVQLAGLSKAWDIKEVTDQVRSAILGELRKKGFRSTSGAVFPPYRFWHPRRRQPGERA